MAQRSEFYNGNRLLKKGNIATSWTLEQLRELRKCRKDPIYFIETYCKVVDLDEGLIPFLLRPYQKEMVLAMHQNRNTIVATARQVGKSVAAVGYVLWYIIFNESKNVAILANKGETAREILGRVQLAYEHLPMWIKQGTVEWNKGSLELENGCKVLAGATSASAIRGFSINLLIIDEAAHIDNWDEFFSAVYPTISSGKKSKLVLISTPNGLNHFHKIYADAELGRNDYKRILVTWDQVPGRDKSWMETTLANMGFNYEKFAQEYEVAFVGSSGTLISGSKLVSMVHQEPKVLSKGLHQYIAPEPGHMYVMSVDTSRGKGLDYSAFQVIDVSKTPYNQVCVYRNNLITAPDYAAICHQVAKLYNEAQVLVEINDLGGQVVDAIHQDFEYENIVYTGIRGKNGKTLSSGFGGVSNSERGVRTTKTVKNTGCSVLKMLIEQDQLIINDHNTMEELNHFVRKGTSYEAELDKHDDLVMGLVLFAWMSDQKYFKEMVDSDIRQALREISEEQVLADLMPFGYFHDGIDYNQGKFIQTVDDIGESTSYEQWGGFNWH